jgi:CheY-like chemotaxis protein
MDIRMPRLDGPAAAARIRGEEGPNRDAPILAFSADSEFTGEEDGFAFDGIVRKPLSPADLIGGLQRCL